MTVHRHNWLVTRAVGKSLEASPAGIATELRAILGLLKRRLCDQGGMDGLTPSQVSALARLERDGPCTASTLARAEGVRQQSMAAVVAALVERGFVAGAPAPDDGRRTVLALTPAAREWFATGRAIRQDWLTRVIARDLTADEQRDLAQGLALLRRVAEA